MKKNVLILFSFLLISLFLSSARAEVKEGTQDIRSIQKLAKSLRQSLAVTWAERQKAVERGYETKFDSTFGEAQLLVDNLFVEIKNFLENQNSGQIPGEKARAPEISSPEHLNQSSLKIMAQFQVLMEHLQSTLRESKSLSEELSIYPHQASNRVTVAPSHKGRRIRRTIKSKPLLDQEENMGKPSVRYQISGTQIDMPEPADESFIH